jgi:hypothetical protein
LADLLEIIGLMDAESSRVSGDRERHPRRLQYSKVFVLLKNNSVEKARQKLNLLEEYSTNLLADTQSEEFSIFPERELHLKF